MKVIITGITGFIGSNLYLDLLKDGWEVIGTYRNKKNFHRIKDEIDKVRLYKDQFCGSKVISRILKREQIDTIFHLAAQTSHTFSLNYPLNDLITNVHPLVNILESLKKTEKKPYLIFPSSKGVIGTPQIIPIDETHPCNPEDPYSLNKLYNEMLLSLYYKKYKMNSVSFRLANLYGPKQQILSNKKGFINYFIGLGLMNKSIPIFGEGNQKRDITYISDVIDAMKLALSIKPEGFNNMFIGTGKGISLRNIAKRIALETETEVEFIPYPKEFKQIEVGDFIIDPKLSKEILNWGSTVNWKDGIKKTVDYYKSNLAEYLKE